MKLDHGPSKIFLLLLPVLYLALYFNLIYAYGTFFSTRIDPEYPYLFNGLNSAQLLFGQIGHVHHPGTPFQILTGLFIRIIHLFSGREDIVTDVLSRPEYYLHGCSHMLAMCFFGILYWLGLLGYKYKGYLGMSMMQLSPFLSSVVLLVVMTRYTPDRLVICLVLLLAGFVLLRSLDQWSTRQFALASGVVGGIALCTKVSCAPILLIPFLLSGRYRWWFGLATVFFFFLFLLPVFSRIDDFFNFTEKLATHDGLYGSGDARFADPEKIVRNLWFIADRNSGFVILWFVTLMGLGLAWIGKRRVDLFFLSYLTASLILVILVSKHFKNYYLTPVLTLSGLVITYWTKYGLQYGKRKFGTTLAIMMLLILLGIAQWTFWQHHRSGVPNRQSTAKQVSLYKQLDRDSVFLLVDPSWRATPFVENGLSFGVSYIRHHDRFLPFIRELFPHVLTYEGVGKPLKKLRVDEVNNNEVYNSGKPVFFYSRSERRTDEILGYFEKSSRELHWQFQWDTMASFDNVNILQLQFNR